MEYKHFSHEHSLTLYKVETGQQFECHGCHLQCDESVFACWKCNFFLHEHCGNSNRYVKHPSHPVHPLILMPNPTYCSASFLCNACGAPGSSFSYSCALCEVDLHVPCAYLPPKVKHHSHQHHIYLSFKPTGQVDPTLHCKICSKELSTKHWYYFCDQPECAFRVHTFCATSEVKTGMYQDDQMEDPSNPKTGSYQPGPDEILAGMFQQLQMAQQLNHIINSSRN